MAKPLRTDSTNSNKIVDSLNISDNYDIYQSKGYLARLPVSTQGDYCDFFANGNNSNNLLQHCIVNIQSFILMERPEFLEILRKAIKSFNGFAPLGIFADIDEGEYREAMSATIRDDLQNFSMEEFIACYFDELRRGTNFTEYENLWMLENIAMHPEFVTLNEVKLLVDLYVKLINTKAHSRIFCVMLLINIDKSLPVNQSFVSYLIKIVHGPESQLSQKDTLIDLIDVMADLGSLKHEDKALKFILRYAQSNNLNYVIEKILNLSIPYGSEMTERIRQWIEKGN